jgi:hypothetical protein
MAWRRAVEQNLITTTVAGEFDGMHVDLSADAMSERDRRRQPVPDNLEAVVEQQFSDADHGPASKTRSTSSWCLVCSSLRAPTPSSAKRSSTPRT